MQLVLDLNSSCYFPWLPLYAHGLPTPCSALLLNLGVVEVANEKIVVLEQMYRHRVAVGVLDCVGVSGIRCFFPVRGRALRCVAHETAGYARVLPRQL